MVRPKKFLGQHFLHDQNTAQKIVSALGVEERPGIAVLEIGPGTGVLTQYLIPRFPQSLWAVEIDTESVAYLRRHYSALGDRLIQGDFLEMNLDHLQRDVEWFIIGNFPYHISSQIFFSVLKSYRQVTQVVCMLQKEVAARIASPHGNKTYGILSVLLQAYYDVEYLFSVPPGAFHPPPKVTSAVIRLTRNARAALPCSDSAFREVVKQGFNNRRKTLRNALKNLNLPTEISSSLQFDKRAEQLSVEDFIQLTVVIENWRANGSV